MKTLLITLLLILIVTSCTPYRYLSKHHNEICSKCIDEYTSSIDTTKKIIIKHDTIWQDVSQNLHDTVQISLTCDSLGIVHIGTIKQLNKLQNILSTYSLKNNILQISNDKFRDTIRTLRTTIQLLRNNVKVIEKPAEIIYKTPVWVWFIGGFIVLFMIILLIIVIKK